MLKPTLILFLWQTVVTLFVYWTWIVSFCMVMTSSTESPAPRHVHAPTYHHRQMQ